jgi:hypothetical protein
MPENVESHCETKHLVKRQSSKCYQVVETP